MNPKLNYIRGHLVSGQTSIIGTEDKAYWTSGEQGVTLHNDVNSVISGNVTVLAEVLQKQDNPVAYIKTAMEKAPALIITVPNEYAWMPLHKPFTNKDHKQNYDCELLAEHLEEAGLKYVIEVVEFGGWSFIAAQASKHGT